MTTREVGAHMRVPPNLWSEEAQTITMILTQSIISHGAVPGTVHTELRDHLDALDRAANEAVVPEPAEVPEAEEKAAASAKTQTTGKAAVEAPALEQAPFSDSLIRWAKLPPKLDASDISGYLYLAASFAGIELVSNALPERLRDIASALTSSVQVDRNAVTDDALRAVKPADARLLIDYLGSLTRDQPMVQKFSVPGILRLVKTHPGIEEAAVAALKLLPSSEVKAGTVMQVRPEDSGTYEAVLAAWDTDRASEQVKRAIQSVRDSWSGADGN